MWIFSKQGFFEIVQFPGHLEELVVRSQSRESIKGLIDLLDEIASIPHQIINEGDTYCTRVDRPIVAVALGRLAMSITYERFAQSACQIHLGKDTQAILTVQQNTLQITTVANVSHL